MLHAKFQDHRTSGSLKVFTLYGHGGHLFHVAINKQTSQGCFT